MNSENWEKVQQLFETALQKKPQERESFLLDACGKDNDLYKEVSSLLKEDADSASSILEGAAIDAVRISFFDEISGEFSAEGKQVGKYKLLKKIATGGMGAVYLAERTDGQFEHKVAVKLIKPGMDSEQIIRRFRNERQILANLDHPNIAQLLDGGLMEGNLPYFTMEYVEGEPIDVYCKKNKLSITDKLKLFQTVCDTVQYAHRNLVIHRDIKPGNIMVTADGTVKLLDFGIAKVFGTEEEIPQMTALTQPGLKVMTPEYASPEQIQGKPVTTSTDVYSLGLILYQLLAEVHPFDFDEKSTSAIEQMICEENPPKPSTIFKKHLINDDGSNNREASNSEYNLKKLKKELRGDLDTICLMALRKEPQRRYSSPEQLSEDIDRYLTGRPINALRDSITYRSRKFVHRHKPSVIAAIISFIIINTLVIYYTFQLAAERDRAQLEAEKSAQVSDFLIKLFEVSDPSQSKGETITARELLDKSAEQIEQDSTMNIELQAQLLHVMGKVYGSLGLYSKGEKFVNKALLLRKSILDNDNPDIGISLWSLGVLYEQIGKYQDAADTQKLAVKILQEYSDEKPKELANALHSFAHAQMRIYNLEDAEWLINEALLLKRKIYGDQSKEVAYSLNILGDLYSYQKRGKDAEQIHRQVLKMRREIYGNNHIDVSVTLHNLAAALRYQGRNAEAETYYRDALKIWLKIYGTEHQEIGNVLDQLATVVRRQGRYEEAIQLLEKSIKILRNIFKNSDHPRLANSLAHYGRALYDAGKYEEAETSYRAGIEMHRRLIGGKGKTNNEMWWLAGLGRVVQKQGDFQEAEKLFLESQNISQNFNNNKEFADSLNIYLKELYKSWINEK